MKDCLPLDNEKVSYTSDNKMMTSLMVFLG